MNSHRQRQSINRNIVECKVGYSRDGVENVKVLIETLWNVKGSCAAYE